MKPEKLKIGDFYYVVANDWQIEKVKFIQIKEEEDYSAGYYERTIWCVVESENKEIRFFFPEELFESYENLKNQLLNTLKSKEQWLLKEIQNTTKSLNEIQSKIERLS